MRLSRKNKLNSKYRAIKTKLRQILLESYIIGKKTMMYLITIKCKRVTNYSVTTYITKII